MIEDLKINQDQSSMTSHELGMKVGLGHPAYQDVFDHLIFAGVERRVAYPIVKKVAFEFGEQDVLDPDQVMDQAAYELLEQLKVYQPIAQLNPKLQSNDPPKVIALVGPTGVGKTTTLAKFCSKMILEKNLKVALVNLDSYRIGANEQLYTYSQLMGIPFRSVQNSEELNVAIQDLHKMDVILLDTAGRSQRDHEALNETKELIQSLTIPVETHLVVSATTRDQELYQIVSRFRCFGPRSIFVTKLDESSQYGMLLNLHAKTQIPLGAFAVGQKVPEDFEEATAERVVALLLDL
jgi:flagellar biosynthesis protein FlhF